MSMVVNSQVPNACRREDKIAVRRMFTKLQTYSYIQLFKRFEEKVLFQMPKHEVLIFLNSKAHMSEMLGKMTFLLLIWNLKFFRGSTRIKDKKRV